MARYFQIMNGLRGCYMPDSSAIIKCDTRRELKSAIESEAYYIRDAGFVGLTKRDPAWAAALLWRKASSQAILPYGHSRDSLAFAIDVSVSTRADYLEYLENSDY